MPLTSIELEEAKLQFLARFRSRYRRESRENVALRDAMTSASKECHLYKPGFSQSERYRGPRKGWSMKLDKLLVKYKQMEKDDEPLTPEIFKSDADSLKAYMMKNYETYFYDSIDRSYLPGFRIAHAQKSLSLILKHNWCMGNLQNDPPVCVLDRQILKAAGVDVNKYTWTRIDTWEEYDEMIGFLQKAANSSQWAPISLAQWELITFG